jgi:chromosome segregation ATPase
MAEFIEILSPTALADLQKGNAEIVTMIANIDKVGQKMAKISTPSGGDAGIKGLTASYVKQEEAISKLQIAIEKVAQAQNRTKISNNAVEKSNLSLEASIERKNKALDREQAKLTAAQNLYNKTQKQVNVLTQAYNDLMIRKLRYDNLNANEEKRLLTLQRVTERYNTTLKAVDATVGKHTRNVGNYAGAFNPLSNSINQLTREMPAFTYSVQTGFMALSNNIPIFTDAIKNAIDQNKIL